MTLYSLVLFIHVSTVLVLAAVMSLETLFLYRLRRASTESEALAWIEPVPVTAPGCSHRRAHHRAFGNLLDSSNGCV